MTAPSLPKGIFAFIGTCLVIATLYLWFFRQGQVRYNYAGAMIDSDEKTLLWKPSYFGEQNRSGRVLDRKEFLGFEFITFGGANTPQETLVMAPTIPLVVVGLTLGIALIVPESLHNRIIRREKRRLKEGKCPQCGFDIRAQEKGGNCPECGHFVL